MEKFEKSPIRAVEEESLKVMAAMPYHFKMSGDCQESEMLFKKTLRQMDLMLEVSRRILNMDNLSDIFHFILKQVILTIDKEALGSVMVKEEDELKVVAAQGYSEEVYGFRIPLEDSFLYQASKGHIKGVAIVKDITILTPARKFYVGRDKTRFLKSTMTAPIFIDGELFGMINIDSTDRNAFDETDRLSMEFIRLHTEIAVGNHFLFQEKAFMAHHDHLTGLYNRYYFDQEFAKLRKKALRYQENFSMVMVDIDNLKKINDESGHLVGDAVISKVASLMKKNIRTSDVLARYGGDEFVGVFFNADSLDLDQKFKWILSQAQNVGCEVCPDDLKPSFSYGIAQFPEDGTELKDLIGKADERMYQSKIGK